MPNWTEQERRDFDELKERTTDYYNREVALVMNAMTKEICLLPMKRLTTGRQVTLPGPIIPLSVADAKILVTDLLMAIEQRQHYLERNP